MKKYYEVEVKIVAKETGKEVKGVLRETERGIYFIREGVVDYLRDC